ncbi:MULTISPECIES: cyclic nucleotide-binding/CBS domain-containing protein [unclassified Rhodoferax]|uniref:CBS domain-containing protein n=1 Tax=unclassified Rhodoferax TaxID=2627954 RepID=UPI0015D434CE|nr:MULTISPECIES: CBS domain-containing protein [unclassified Rhodoferax]MBT3065567.1 CBS domain-containing protein [Rhodoferax sp. U11-2br]
MPERTVSQSMAQRHVISVLPTATVHAAACVMMRTNSSSVLVIDTNKTMLGIVTERDMINRVLAKTVDPSRTTVAEVMTRSPHCVNPETKVADAVLMMIERGFRHLPVVSTDGHKILGVFCLRDALPREVHAAVNLAEFNEQVNDALG